MTPLEREAIRQEFHRDGRSRFLLRLHVLLMVDAGFTCTALGKQMGMNPITLMRWIKRYDEAGVTGLLYEKHRGRPKSMDRFQWNRLERDLEKSPRFFGFSYDHWDGPALGEHLQRHYGIQLGLRQCQRILSGKVFVFESSGNVLLQHSGLTAKGAVAAQSIEVEESVIR